MARWNARTRSPHGGEIVPAGDAAVLVRLGAAISPAAHARVMALLHALDAEPPGGLRDLVPAYASLLVLFDPAATSAEAVKAHLHALLAGPPAHRRSKRGRLVRIPVHYGGADGPDLQEVARLTGIPPEEVMQRHAGVTYRVYFLGFVAGFPYLGGLPKELAVPRLASPRPRVPAGSVGIGGQQTGIYPVAAPGGWRLIGQTAARLFDSAADPPALLRPGDRVRFEPSKRSAAPPSRSEEGCGDHVTTDEGAAPSSADASVESMAMAGESVPWVRVRVPGPLTTVQDLDRAGYARYGVSTSGAADADALRLGNALIGNPMDAAGLELTLGGVDLEVLSPCAAALTGAECQVHIGGRRAEPGVALALAEGDTLSIGPAERGVRSYLCVAGGVAVPPVLGSRATDLRAGLGGLQGRPLRVGDVLGRGMTSESSAPLLRRRLPPDDERRWPAGDGWVVRILAGPHAAQARADLDALQAATYLVDPRSDRVGVRLCRRDPSEQRLVVGGETLTEGVPRGAVQLPPDGEPIILLADHQTTGGYRIPAVVASVDLWRVAQLRPGDRVRFALVTPEAASAARQARREWLEQLAADFAAGSAVPAGAHAQPGEPDVDLLMRGFAEWSEEAWDDE